jgi:hypothetical protein
MKTYKMLVELKIDDKMMYGNDEEAKEWFEKDILMDSELIMHENDQIGDSLGNVKVLKILEIY